jgi:hypothetical protein
MVVAIFGISFALLLLIVVGVGGPKENDLFTFRVDTYIIQTRARAPRPRLGMIRKVYGYRRQGIGKFGIWTPWIQITSTSRYPRHQWECELWVVPGILVLVCFQ